MLPKKQRIPRELFTELLLRSKYANSLFFTLRYRSPEGAISRFGVSVSKKVSKSAVVRNAIRRRVYTSVRIFEGSIPPGLYLFVAKPTSQNIKGEKLVEEIRNLLKVAKFIV